MIFSTKKQKHTAIDWPTYPQLSHKKIGFLGSCFAAEVGKLFDHVYYPSWYNPGGTLYNPASIALFLERMLNKQIFQKEELFITQQKQYAHWLFSTQHTHSSQETLIAELNEIQKKFQQDWDRTGTIVISLGTTSYFELTNDLSQNKIVANCHKELSSIFNSKIMDQNECTSWLKRISDLCQGKTLMFTISPVRYLKNGAAQNSLSKATLRLAIENLINSNSIFYVPIFEFVMDELRDYSHYADDAKHLNEKSIRLIADRFVGNYLDKESQTLLKSGWELRILEDHRLINIGQKKAHQLKIDERRSQYFKQLEAFLENCV